MPTSLQSLIFPAMYLLDAKLFPTCMMRRLGVLFVVWIRLSIWFFKFVFRVVTYSLIKVLNCKYFSSVMLDISFC